LPRKKTFDEQATLRKIALLFWRNGYVATGMDQICDHVSLPKPSIYNAYGDKATLFRKVVDWYAEEMLNQGVGILKGEAPVSEEIAALLRYFLVRPEPHIVAQGCLLTTTMMELQYSEPELFDYVRAQVSRVTNAIEGYLSNARQDGWLQPDSDPRALSEYIFTILQGLRMQSRTSAGMVNLDRIISIAMGPLKEAEPSTKRRKLATH